MSTNDPSGYGYPTDPGQNPYGQQPQYGAPQPPYDAPQQPYGAPQPPYGQAQPPYGQAQYTQAWPAWLAPPGPYGAAPVPGTRTLASAGDRFLARLIDAAVLLIPTILVFAVIGNGFLGAILQALIVFGYEIVMLLTQGGQTVGKKVMKLRVVDLAHGGRPVDNNLWFRAGVYGLPSAVYCLGSLFTLLNVLWHLWDKPLQQCLHDKAAKTVVVKEG